MNHFKAMKLIFITTITCLLAACAGTPKQPTTYWLYPSDADVVAGSPQVQFLTGFSDSSWSDGPQSRSFWAKGLGVDSDASPTKPYGVATWKTRIFVTDTIGSTIYIVDPVEHIFRPIDGDIGSGKLIKPINIAVDADGTLYVADTGRKAVLNYSADGAKLIRAIGSGEDWQPNGIAVTADRLYVTDVAHSSLQIRDKATGTLIRTIGKGPTATKKDSVNLPVAVKVRDGRVYVLNLGSPNAVVFDLDGKALSSIGSGEVGDQPYEMQRPRGLDVDGNGYVYISDAGAQNLKMYNREGRLLNIVGPPNYPKVVLDMPAAVHVSTANLEFFQQYAAPDFVVESLIYVVSQQPVEGVDKVQIYGLGRRTTAQRGGV